MHKIILYLTFALCLCILPGCSDEPEQARLFSDNNSEVTINADGTTSTGVPYSPFGKQSFFLDHIIYVIDGDRAMIIGYNTNLIAEHVRPYAYITYDGVRYPVTEIAPQALSQSERIKSIELPTTITTIGYNAFIDDINLSTVLLSPNTDAIMPEVFAHCIALKSISIPDGVQQIQYGTFSECYSLETVKFPTSLKYIGNNAFINCMKLDNVTLPSNLKSLGEYSFCGCIKLRSITIPNGITELSNGAFNGCTNLSSITLPETLTTIGYSAFGGCIAMESITLPSKVSNIENRAFSYCTNLNNVTSFNPEPPHCSYDIFNGIYGTMTLYVPAASVNKYKAANCWRDFANIVGI